MALSEIREQSSLDPIRASLSDWQVNDSEQCLSYLYEIVVRSHVIQSYNESIGLMLDAGKRRFDMEYALVIRPVSDAVFEVLAFSCDEDGSLYVGQHISTADFLCHYVRECSQPHFVADIQGMGNSVSPLAYGGLAVNSYVGIPVNTQLATKGVLCFFSSTPSAAALTEENKNLIERISDGVAFLIDQQKTQSQRKNIDSTMFANGSMNTLDEYLEQSKIPELYGIPGRVVDVLKARIGQSPLSIGHVAEDLSLSKRTLQRRLQQQSVNFAELRDQVRYHYSIDYLVKNRMSIDSISAALDFSDRTSFTNAFKRWTGMSPSTFRKLFRDFV